MNNNHSVRHISDFAKNDPVHYTAHRPWIIFNHDLGSPVHSCTTCQEAMATALRWNEEEQDEVGFEDENPTDLDNPSPSIG